MFVFSDENTLYNSIDACVKDWVRSNYDRYDTFKDMSKDFSSHIKEVFPSGIDENMLSLSFQSFKNTARHSTLVKIILDQVLEKYETSDVTGIVYALYKEFAVTRFIFNSEIFERVWNEKHTNHETNRKLFSNSLGKESPFTRYDLESDIMSYLAKRFSNRDISDYKMLNWSAKHHVELLKYDRDNGYFDYGETDLLWKRLVTCLENESPFGIPFGKYSEYVKDERTLDNVLFFYNGMAYQMFFGPGIEYLLGSKRGWETKDFSSELIELTGCFYKAFKLTGVWLDSNIRKLGGYQQTEVS
ncbi:MAG: hypothetical protein [Bacteriophage sp.]|nr:MAG: hypothetical protein [Bacteriophage sp.]